MSNFPFRDPSEVRSMSRAELEDLLRQFEDTWSAQEGERITSAQFYDQHAVGEHDSVFGMAWASYYEIYRRLGQRQEHAELVDRLVAGLALRGVPHGRPTHPRHHRPRLKP